METQKFFETAAPVIAAFGTFATDHQLAGRAAAEHICYKCASSASFEAIRAMFESESTFIYQSIISKRRIAIIRFREPLDTALGPITVLELSDQKPDGSQTEGFDHVEIYPTTGSIDDLVAYLQSKDVAIETVSRPHHTTHDIVLAGGFKVRIEDEPLLNKIKREEMR